MERILTVCQMRNADKLTIEKLGVSEDELVNRAGNAVADVIKKQFQGGRVLVCVGKGNNGKDGLVVADVLSKTHGFAVDIFDVEKSNESQFDKKYDILIYCIFGTGLNKEITGKYKQIIERINTLNCYKISCDIPSGINGENGKIMGVAVKSDLTVAIQEYKVGHFFGDGIDYCGKIVCKDIGISVWDENVIKRIDNRDARKNFEQRARNVHKGCFGKACVIGGSRDLSGSVLLSANALASLKSGVGYSYMCVPKSLFNAYVGKTPETILISLNDDENSIVLDKESLEKVMHCDCIAIGMGLSTTKGVYDTIEYLLKNYKGTLLIDADGLNSISNFGKDVLKEKTCKVVLTPHIGEFSKLLCVDKKNLIDNIIPYAVDFAREYGVILVVKSAISVITDGKEVYLNTTGCSGMAKAGSGDVLSGFMSGMLARVPDSLDAVLCSVYVFGLAGESAQKKYNEYTITATEIINEIPAVINSL